MRKAIAIALLASLASLAAFASRGNGGAVRGAAARAGMMAAYGFHAEGVFAELVVPDGAVISFGTTSLGNMGGVIYGDGTMVEDVAVAPASHTYAVGGTYICQFFGTAVNFSGNATLPWICRTNGTTNRTVLVRVWSEGKNHATSVGNYAFNGCTALTEARFPFATSVGNYAFNGCTALTGFSLGNGCTISSYAFSRCSNLSNVNLDGVVQIGAEAFSYGRSGAYFHSSTLLRIIGGQSFRGTTSLNLDFPALVRCEGLGANTSFTIINTPNLTTLSGYIFAYGSASRWNCQKLALSSSVVTVASIGIIDNSSFTCATIKARSGFPHGVGTSAKFIGSDGYITYINGNWVITYN